ncbi:HNH endonuclease [Pullulanibacillus sp. KACC 23026]|uniref:NUMOD4 domain-containing protein n=1 Tax=Pullulanibacillus sp. KACC 23026 TaxID=3028315 RepID=UPI0023B01707|nr:HNH endonuclease [Pullulanibacillus sp. KACC 23026]WEG14140.1 HNH endonuclease [Pullulanibacillus sp. KACC 23026]
MNLKKRIEVMPSMTNRKEIKGFEGLYADDTSGNVWSLKHDAHRRKKKLKPYVNTGGYLRVNLYDENSKVSKCYVHRLVAQAFIPNPFDLPDVNHISANKSDNTLSNLEWCDAKYNIAESRRLGLQSDKNVKAFSIITGEIRNYERIKDAATDIAGKHWAFGYLRKRHGDRFYYREWRIEVMPS